MMMYLLDLVSLEIGSTRSGKIETNLCGQAELVIRSPSGGTAYPIGKQAFHTRCGALTERNSRIDKRIDRLRQDAARIQTQIERLEALKEEKS